MCGTAFWVYFWAVQTTAWWKKLEMLGWIRCLRVGQAGWTNPWPGSSLGSSQNNLLHLRLSYLSQTRDGINVSKPSAWRPESRDPHPGFLSYQVENAFSEIENPAGSLPSRTGFGHACRKQSLPSKLWVSTEADNPLLPAAVCLKSSLKLYL